MKNKLFTFILLAFTYTVTKAQVNNFDFEQGNLSGWTLETGVVDYDGNTPFYLPDDPTFDDQFEILSPSSPSLHEYFTLCGDSTVSTTFKPGSYSLRLGDLTGGQKYAKISRTFTVTDDLSYLSYQYCIVVEDPEHDHSTLEKPQFVVTVKNKDGSIIPDKTCGKFNVYAGNQAKGLGFKDDCVFDDEYKCTFPISDCSNSLFDDTDLPPGFGEGFQTPDNTKQILKWTASGADLSTFIGQEVTIEFMTVDCLKGAHGIMAFIDASLAPLEIDILGFCDDSGGSNATTLIAPDGFQNYEWTMVDTPGVIIGTNDTLVLQNANMGDEIKVKLIPFTGESCATEITKKLQTELDAVVYPIPDTTICAGADLTITPDGENVGRYIFPFVPDTALYTTISPETTTTYQVSALDQNGCPSGNTVEFTVEVIPNSGDNPNHPKADFEISTSDNCVSITTTNLSGYCRGNLTYEWDFGDGTTSSEFEPTKTYQLTSGGNSTFTITLTVTSEDGLTDSKSIDFEAAGLVEPNFSLKEENCGTLTFNNNSLICGANYDENPNFFYVWDFGDGTATDTTTHEGSSTSHQYAASGTYTVTLTAINRDDLSEYPVSKDFKIETSNYARFTYSKQCLSVRFRDRSSICTPIDSIAWTFGDGTTSDKKNPVHRYKSIDNYAVTLKVISGTDTLQYQDSVKLKDQLRVNFSQQSLGCGLVRFYNGSPSCNNLASLKYIWEFGDNETDTVRGENFVEHYYATSGTYQVNLTMLDTISGVFIKPKIDPIEISIDDKADFSVRKRGCRGIKLKDQSVACHTVDSWLWEFGDGSTSTQQHPAHTYESFDKFSVTLTVTDTLGNVLPPLTKTVDITDQFSVAISARELECGTIELVNPTKCVAPSVKYRWIFDDGDTITTPSSENTILHTYLQSGQYTPSVTAIDTVSNETRTIKASTIQIDRNDFSFFTYTTDCKAVMFTDSSVFCNEITSWEWNFGDGSPTVSEQNPTHSYPEYGEYPVTLTVTDGTITRAKTLSVSVENTLSPDFTVIDEGCATFTFIDQSVHCEGYTRFWTFGDGQTSSDSIVTHQYKSNVDYNATLIISNNGIKEEVTKAVAVRDILAPLSPVDMVGCAGPDTTYAEFVFEPVQTDTITYLFKKANRDRLTLTYFGTLADAQLNVNALDISPTYDSDPGSIYVRITDTKYGESCYELDSFNIAVHNSAHMDYIKNIELCNPNETSRLYPLEDMKAEVFDKLDKTDVTVSFHESIEDAYSNEFEISEIEIDAQVDAVVYVRVENVLTPNCASVYSFTIRLNEIYLDEYDETCPIDIANALTPNDDGMNDTFYISGLQFYPDNKLKIFNRWGNLIYETARYENEWDGTYKGRMLPMAAYYYVLDLGNNKTYSGTISIIR